MVSSDNEYPSVSSAASDSERLACVRAILEGFNWEHDNRQYALEAIDAAVFPESNPRDC